MALPHVQLSEERLSLVEALLDYTIKQLKDNDLGQLRVRIGDVTITIVGKGEKAPEGEEG